MAKETIMLAKKFDSSKVEFPCLVTEKLDGVAADFYTERKLGGDFTFVRSRQDKPILSVNHIRKWLNGKLPPGHHAICELYIPGEDFQVISGLSRQHGIASNLKAYIYDYYVEGQEEDSYSDRMIEAFKSLGGFLCSDCPVRLISGHHVKSLDELQKVIDDFFMARPEAEGLVIRSLRGKSSGYKFGRSWGMMKLKKTDTLDLEVHSFEEAIDKNGNKKGMVGRINVILDTGASSDGKNDYTEFSIIGAGPGKMDHRERKEVWENRNKYIGKIAEIAYMPDQAYKALREPRFLRWREDKDA